jgi:hypothetical protein
VSDGDAPRPLAYQSNQPPRPPTAVCPKCASRMIQGVAFVRGGRGAFARTVWVAGQMRRGLFGTPRLPRGKLFEVIAFRCPACGFVEHYCPPG